MHKTLYNISKGRWREVSPLLMPAGAHGYERLQNFCSEA